MKASELMIGDWVMLDGIPKHLTLWDIVRISRSVYTAEPIPLTEEILKANGFHLYDDFDWLHPDAIFISVSRGRSGKWTINDVDTIRMESVHQIQHALRLCGLKELADNFKIE